MRYPSIEMAVIDATQLLNRMPNRLRWNKNNGGRIGFMSRHFISLCAITQGKWVDIICPTFAYFS